MESQPGPPPAGSGDKIRHEYFAWARRGFDPREVREFLAAIASAIENLETELRRARADAAAQGEDAGRSAYAPVQLAERAARLIAVAEREGESTLEEARANAATIVSEAKSEAERIRSAAQDEAGRAVNESRVYVEQSKEEAGRKLSDLVDRRRRMIEAIRQTQERLVGIAQDLGLERDPNGSDGVGPKAEE